MQHERVQNTVDASPGLGHQEVVGEKSLLDRNWVGKYQACNTISTWAIVSSANKIQVGDAEQR